MRGLSRAADQSKLWFAIAAAMALLGGPSGRFAARKGLVSLGTAPGLAHLVAQALRPPRRPPWNDGQVLPRRHDHMPRPRALPLRPAPPALALVPHPAHVP